MTDRSAHLLAVCLMALLAAACASETPQQIRDALPDVLIPDAARNVRRGSVGRGNTSVEFELSEPYPASHLICEVAAHLDARQWRALPESFLNPGSKSSLAAGWGPAVIDGRSQPEMLSFGWQAQWISSDHRLIMYGLEYRTPNTKQSPFSYPARPLPSLVKVTVVLWSPEVAEAVDAARLQDQARLATPSGWVTAQTCAPSNWTPFVSQPFRVPPAPAPLELAQIRSIEPASGIDILGSRLTTALAGFPDLHVGAFGEPLSEGDAYLSFRTDRRYKVPGLPDGFFVQEAYIYAIGRGVPLVLFHWSDGGDPAWKHLPSECTTKPAMSPSCKNALERADLFGFIDALVSTMGVMRAR